MTSQYCNNCGQLISNNNGCCPKCGASLSMNNSSTHSLNSQPRTYIQNNNQSSKTNTQKLIIIIGSSIIILLLVLIILLLLIDNNKNIKESSHSKSEQIEQKTQVPNDTTSTDETNESQNEEASNDSQEPISQRHAMVINDADGWTNIRTSPSSNASIVEKVYDGTVFYVTYINGSKWCEFYWSENGPLVGYIYKKYIKPVGSSKTPPNQAKSNSSYGKYHVIIGSYNYKDQAELMVRNCPYYATIIYNQKLKKYRVSAYNSNSKADAENALYDIKGYYDNAWILTE